jgi:hypothetical protein
MRRDLEHDATYCASASEIPKNGPTDPFHSPLPIKAIDLRENELYDSPDQSSHWWYVKALN